MASLNFSTSGQAEMDDFSVVPVGDYNAQIVKSELKDTKAGDGKRLNFQFKILDGEFKGRILFVGLNVQNPNPTAVEISMKELTSICKACKKEAVEDSGELHNIPLKISVKIKPASGNYAEQNQIIKYMPYDGIDAAATTTTKASGDKAETAKAGSDKMPWEG